MCIRDRPVSDTLFISQATDHNLLIARSNVTKLVGIKSVLKNLKRMYPNSSLYGLLCLKGDKEVDSIAECIKSQFEMLFVSTSKDGLLLSSKKLSEKLNKLKVVNSPSSDISSSISKIKKIRKPNDVILIFGSHYIANEIYSDFEMSFDSGLN